MSRGEGDGLALLRAEGKMSTGQTQQRSIIDLVSFEIGRSFSYIAAQGSRSDWLVTTFDAGMIMGESPAGSTTGTMQFDGGGISFSSGEVLLTLSDEEGAEVARLYQAAFGRSPDIGGLDHWITAWKMEGLSLSEISAHLIQSSEFTGIYGAVSNTTSRDYVNSLYVNVLGRQPDSGGLDYWAMMLDSAAATRAEILATFSSSAENRDRTNSWLINREEDDPHLRELSNWYRTTNGEGEPETQGSDIRISEIDFSTTEQSGGWHLGPGYMALPDQKMILVADNANRTVYSPDDVPWVVQSTNMGNTHKFVAGNAGANFAILMVSGEMILGSGRDMVSATDPWRPVDVVNFNPLVDLVHAAATNSTVTSISSASSFSGQTVQGETIFFVNSSDSSTLGVAKALLDAGVRVGASDYFTILAEHSDGVIVLDFGDRSNYSNPNPGDMNSNGLVDASELDATLLLRGVSVEDLTPSNFRYLDWGS